MMERITARGRGKRSTPSATKDNLVWQRMLDTDAISGNSYMMVSSLPEDERRGEFPRSYRLYDQTMFLRVYYAISEDATWEDPNTLACLLLLSSRKMEHTKDRNPKPHVYGAEMVHHAIPGVLQYKEDLQQAAETTAGNILARFLNADQIKAPTGTVSLAETLSPRRRGNARGRGNRSLASIPKPDPVWRQLIESSEPSSMTYLKRSVMPEEQRRQQFPYSHRLYDPTTFVRVQHAFEEDEDWRDPAVLAGVLVLAAEEMERRQDRQPNPYVYGAYVVEQVLPTVLSNRNGVFQQAWESMAGDGLSAFMNIESIDPPTETVPLAEALSPRRRTVARGRGLSKQVRPANYPRGAIPPQVDSKEERRKAIQRSHVKSVPELQAVLSYGDIFLGADGVPVTWQHSQIQIDGRSFDNAGFWPSESNPTLGFAAHEMSFIFFTVDGRPHSVNLATLCGWACEYERQHHNPMEGKPTPATLETPYALAAFANQQQLRKDWHEPDESDVDAEIVFNNPQHVQPSPFVSSSVLASIQECSVRFLVADPSGDEEDTNAPEVLTTVALTDLLRWATNTHQPVSLEQPTEVVDLGQQLLGKRRS